jgi:hypothetical protein
VTILGSIDHAPRKGIADLQTGLLDYAGHVDELRSPEEVLNELHAVTTRSLSLPVLGALRLPIKSGDWESIQLGKSVFLHEDVPPRGGGRNIVFTLPGNFVQFSSLPAPAWRRTPGLKSGD